jgi:hypothetical protein
MIEFNEPTNIYDKNGSHLAILIPGSYSPTKIEFITKPDNLFQIGLMKRSSESPAPAHHHNKIARTILGTQEFLLVKQGAMFVKLLEPSGNIIEEFNLSSGDAILLISGGHEITFSDDCIILEIKQGPYTQEEDKSQIPSLLRSGKN